jgi:hypothetical protein
LGGGRAAPLLDCQFIVAASTHLDVTSPADASRNEVDGASLEIHERNKCAASIARRWTLSLLPFDTPALVLPLFVFPLKKPPLFVFFFP